jgi:hypothetical protein
MKGEPHELKAAITGDARCTVCIKCGSLWWTPKPAKDTSIYHPPTCEREDGPPVGVYILLNDANGRLPFDAELGETTG